METTPDSIDVRLPPRPLQPGDLVAIAAPSGAFSEDRLRRGEASLEARGYRVRRYLPPRPHRYFAGTDAERLRSLHDAFADPEVRAVFTARGGYGASRLLGGLDGDLLAQSGKPLIGFSDLTVLHLFLHARGARSIHGPVVTRLGEEPEESRERLFRMLEESSPPPPLRGRTVVEGMAEGPLVGGCLSLLASLVGTPHLPRLDGCILFLEEVGEAPYRIDRLLTQLRDSGVLEGVAGVAIGELTDCDGPLARGAEVAQEILCELGKPMIVDLPFGHGERNLALPHGAPARIEGGALHFLEGIW